MNVEQPVEKKKLKRKDYEKELRDLQVELCHLQAWVKSTGARIIIVFEGRDAAGKGGTIRAMTERVSPRVFRVVALPAPSDRERLRCFFSDICSNSPRPARSSSSIAAGTTGPAWNTSWASARPNSTSGFCSSVPRSRNTSSMAAFSSSILARGGEGRARTPLSGSHQRSAAPVEAQPHGPRVIPPLVRLFGGAR